MNLKCVIVIFLLLTVQNIIHSQEPQIIQKRFETDYALRDTVDYIGNLYIHYPGQHPSVLTFVNNDGSVTVCASDDSAKVTWIYEFSMDLREQKRFSIPNEYDMLGAFTKDNEGNYYIFYARTTSVRTAENMCTVKYSKNGEKLLTYKLIANARNSFDGVTKPFRAGTCRMELSGSMLAVYFARQMFNGHQASYGFILDKDTFERVDLGAATNDGRMGGVSQIPYTSHSFNQFIVSIENGFLFTDHGDAYPRSFTFAKFIQGQNTKRVHAFKFPGQTGANATYAEMGGTAKTKEGFIFSGAYGTNANNARNVFVLTVDENMNACSNPVYITKYTRNDGHAGHPKIVSINDGRYLILWEFFSFSTQAANLIVSERTGFLSVHAAVIDENGTLLSDIYKLDAPIRLNINDVLRCNPKNGFVYWAVNDTSNSIIVYGLKY